MSQARGIFQYLYISREYTNRTHRIPSHFQKYSMNFCSTERGGGGQSLNRSTTGDQRPFEIVVKLIRRREKRAIIFFFFLVCRAHSNTSSY